MVSEYRVSLYPANSWVNIKWYLPATLVQRLASTNERKRFPCAWFSLTVRHPAFSFLFLNRLILRPEHFRLNQHTTLDLYCSKSFCFHFSSAGLPMNTNLLCICSLHFWCGTQDYAATERAHFFMRISWNKYSTKPDKIFINSMNCITFVCSNYRYDRYAVFFQIYAIPCILGTIASSGALLCS